MSEIVMVKCVNCNEFVQQDTEGICSSCYTEMNAVIAIMGVVEHVGNVSLLDKGSLKKHKAVLQKVANKLQEIVDSV